MSKLMYALFLVSVLLFTQGVKADAEIRTYFPMVEKVDPRVPWCPLAYDYCVRFDSIGDQMFVTTDAQLFEDLSKPWGRILIGGKLYDYLSSEGVGDQYSPFPVKPGFRYLFIQVDGRWMVSSYMYAGVYYEKGD